MAESKIKVLSLGNGCEATRFLHLFGIRDASPFDNSFYPNGPQTLISILSGDFESHLKKDLKSRFENVPEMPEDTHPNIWRSNHAIIDMPSPIFFPHANLAQIKRHVFERYTNFKKAEEDSNSIFMLVNGPTSKFCHPFIYHELTKFDIINPNNLIILSFFLGDYEDVWKNNGFPVISLTEWGKNNDNHSKLFSDDEDVRQTLFPLYDKFCNEYPQIAERIVPPKKD